jgi:signal transduction histidine kinase
MNMFAKLMRLMGASLLALGMAGAAQAAPQAEHGSAAEAEAMVKKAVAFIKANGADKAYGEFTNGTSFKDRDLYVFVYDMTGKNLAHGANAKLVGKDLSGLKDPDGKLVLPLLFEVAKGKGKGWTEEFKFRNPVSEKLEPKVVYVERLGDTLVGCGIYKN